MRYSAMAESLLYMQRQVFNIKHERISGRTYYTKIYIITKHYIIYYGRTHLLKLLHFFISYHPSFILWMTTWRKAMTWGLLIQQKIDTVQVPTYNRPIGATCTGRYSHFSLLVSCTVYPIHEYVQLQVEESSFFILGAIFIRGSWLMTLSCGTVH